MNPQLNYPTHRPIKSTQSGAVLIISLIMLLLLTIIGMASTQSTGLEEKMAGNSRDKNLAFQGAESALKAAENSLVTLPTLPTFTGSGTSGYYNNTLDKTKATGICPTTATGISAASLTNAQSAACLSEAVLTVSFWATASNSHASTITFVNPAPRYIIQDMGCGTTTCPGPHNYRIISRSSGGTTNAMVVLESIYQL